MKEKLIKELFNMYYLTIYIHYLTIYIETSSIVNKGGSVRNGCVRTFWAQKAAPKKSMKFIEIYMTCQQ